MIFVTVGMQMPFPRLITILDKWAAKKNDIEIFAQIGADKRIPSNLNYINFLSISEYIRSVQSAELIVGHGGTGTILTAMQYCIPMLLMPRKKKFGETRNDHQVDTCSYFGRIKAAEIAYDENELLEKLDSWKYIKPPKKIGPFASDLLLKTISNFIDS